MICKPFERYAVITGPRDPTLRGVGRGALMAHDWRIGLAYCDPRLLHRPDLISPLNIFHRCCVPRSRAMLSSTSYDSLTLTLSAVHRAAAPLRLPDLRGSYPLLPAAVALAPPEGQPLVPLGGLYHGVFPNGLVVLWGLETGQPLVWEDFTKPLGDHLEPRYLVDAKKDASVVSVLVRGKDRVPCFIARAKELDRVTQDLKDALSEEGLLLSPRLREL